MKVSTGLTSARRSQAALALDPIPAHTNAEMPHIQFAEVDKHARERPDAETLPPLGEPSAEGTSPRSVVAGSRHWTTRQYITFLARGDRLHVALHPQRHHCALR